MKKQNAHLNLNLKRRTAFHSLFALFCGLTSLLFAPAAESRPTVHAKTADAACLISPEEALYRHHRGATLIDVRSASAYRKYRIPGSLNIPLYAIRVKPYLKAHEIILLDSGPQLKKLLSGCRQLKAGGFKVHVLYGGIVGWRAAGGEIEGMAPSARTPLLAPREFLLEYEPRRWGVIRVTSKLGKRGKSADPLGGEKTIALANAKHGLLEMVEGIQKHRGGTALGPFVAVMADDPTQYAQLAARLKGKARNVYFIAGGTAAYRRARVRLRSIEGKRVFKLQQPANCSPRK